MRFDLPLTAFALESSGAAACALSGAHTLTLPAEVSAEAEDILARLSLAESGEGGGWQAGIGPHAPPTVTITL